MSEQIIKDENESLNDWEKVHINESTEKKKPISESTYCEKCSKRFARKQDLKLHIKTAHDELNEHNCDLCDKRFGYKSSLNKHFRLVHEMVKSLKCNFCGECFREVHNLNKHTKRAHKNLKPFKCNICDKRFSENYALHIPRTFMKMKNLLHVIIVINVLVKRLSWKNTRSLLITT